MFYNIWTPFTLWWSDIDIQTNSHSCTVKCWTGQYQISLYFPLLFIVLYITILESTVECVDCTIVYCTIMSSTSLQSSLSSPLLPSAITKGRMIGGILWQLLFCLYCILLFFTESQELGTLSRYHFSCPSVRPSVRLSVPSEEVAWFYYQLN